MVQGKNQGKSQNLFGFLGISSSRVGSAGLSKLGILCLLGTVPIACKSAQQATASQTLDGNVGGTDGIPKLTAPQEKTLLFTWTYDDSAARDPKGFLRRNLVNIHKQNDALTGFVEGLQAGYGVYFAGDPVNSYSFGDTLIAVEATPGQTFTVSKDSEVPVGYIQERTPGLGYYWGGGTDFAGPYAFVARELSAIKIETAIAMSGKNGTPFRLKKALRRDANMGWQDAFSYVVDVVSLVGRIHEGEQGRAEGDKAYYKPIIDLSTKQLTDQGLLEAIHAEFWHMHPQVEAGWARLFPNGSRSNASMPKCSANLTSANAKALRFKSPCHSDVFRTMESVLDGRDWRGVELSEAHTLLVATGHLDSKSEVPASWEQLIASLLKNFRDSGGADRANDAVFAYEVIIKNFQKWSLQNWFASLPRVDR